MPDADIDAGASNWGDPEVFRELVERTETWLQRYVHGLFRFAPNAVEPARDIVQETYLRFYLAQHTLRNRTDAVAMAFLKRIAENQFVDHCRRNPIVPKQLGNDQMADQDRRRPPVADHTARYERREYAAWRAPRLLDRLTDQERKLFLMRVLDDDVTFQEIADGLEIPLSTAHKIYERALKKLRGDDDDDTNELDKECA